MYQFIRCDESLIQNFIALLFGGGLFFLFLSAFLSGMETNCLLKKKQLSFINWKCWKCSIIILLILQMVMYTMKRIDVCLILNIWIHSLSSGFDFYMLFECFCYEAERCDGHTAYHWCCSLIGQVLFVFFFSNICRFILKLYIL